MAPAQLLWKSPEGEEQSHTLAEGALTLGRSRESELVIADTRISRCHAEIRFENGEYMVADLGSANGTFVNGARLEGPHKLQDKDRIRLGGTEIEFSLPPPPAEPAAIPEAPSRPTLVMAEPARLPCLEVVTGPQAGLRFELIKETAKIGRSGRGRQWDVMLNDRAVSRPHAQVVRQGDGFILTDLGSANGTLVNNQPITEAHTLSDGDAITFGQTVMIFKAGMK